MAEMVYGERHELNPVLGSVSREVVIMYRTNSLAD